MKSTASLFAISIVSVLGVSNVEGAVFKIVHPFSESGAVQEWADELSRCVKKSLDVQTEVSGYKGAGDLSRINYSIVKGLVDVAIMPVYGLVEANPESLSWREYKDGFKVTPTESRFVNIIDDLLRKYGVSTISVAWQYAALGWHKKTPVKSTLKGKTVAVFDPAMRIYLERLGVRTPRTVLDDPVIAMKRGIIDGVVGGPSYLSSQMYSGTVTKLHASLESEPIGRPIFAVMNTAKVNRLGRGLSRELRWACGYTGRKYERQAIDKMYQLFKAADKSNVDVVGKENYEDYVLK